MIFNFFRVCTISSAGRDVFQGNGKGHRTKAAGARVDLHNLKPVYPVADKSGEGIYWRSSGTSKSARSKKGTEGNKNESRYHQERNPMTTRFDMIGIFVNDLHRMVMFYRDVLGFEIVWDGKGPYAEFKHEAFDFPCRNEHNYPAC
jgi:hypothetical protein